MTAEHLMSARQGNTLRRSFRFRGFDGNPISFAGSVVSLTIATPRPIVKTTRDGSLAMTSAVAGEVALHLTAAETRELPVGVVPFEMERAILDERTGEWDEATLLTGMVIVEKGRNDER